MGAGVESNVLGPSDLTIVDAADDTYKYDDVRKRIYVISYTISLYAIKQTNKSLNEVISKAKRLNW